MTKIDSIASTKNPSDYQLAAPQLLALFVAALTLALFSNAAFAQGLSLTLTDAVVPSLSPPSEAITTLSSDFGAYDQRQIESLEDLGRIRRSEGEHLQAFAFFKQALHVARINQGLYHDSQIPIVDDIISAGIGLKNWEEVNNYYAYQEHLFRRLYNMDDPRLEEGLKKISAWHITALNINLDGKRIEHLRKANQLFKLRRKVAENTLAAGDPQFTMLTRNIEYFERQLFLSSDLNREMQVRSQRNPQSRRDSFRQSNRSLVVTAD